MVDSYSFTIVSGTALFMCNLVNEPLDTDPIFSLDELYFLDVNITLENNTFGAFKVMCSMFAQILLHSMTLI